MPKFLNLITYVDESSNEQIIDLQTDGGNNTVPLRDSNGRFKIGTVVSNADGSYAINKAYVDREINSWDFTQSYQAGQIIKGITQENGKIKNVTTYSLADDGNLVHTTGPKTTEPETIGGDKTFEKTVTFENGITGSYEITSADQLVNKGYYKNTRLGYLGYTGGKDSYDDVGDFVRDLDDKVDEELKQRYLKLAIEDGETAQTVAQNVKFTGTANNFTSSSEPIFNIATLNLDWTTQFDAITYNQFVEMLMYPGMLLVRYQTTSSNESITPIKNGPDGFKSIYWGDGTSNTNISDATGSYEHTYVNAGVYDACLVGLKSVRDGMFRPDSGIDNKLKEIIIFDSVTSIGSSAFYNCSGLTSVTIPDSVTSIGDEAFFDCSGLTSITVPDNLTSIGSLVFYNCYKLVEVINNSSLTITKGSNSNGLIGYYALNIKNGGTSDIVNQSGYLFYTYENINYLLGHTGNNTELVLPNNYNGQNYEIYKYAFYDCSSITNITIPDSVTSIGGRAFRGCSGLTSITIPDSVTSIGDFVFAYCSKLAMITVTRPTPATIGTSVFYNTASDFKICVPQSLVSTYQDKWSAYSSKIVEIPS